MSELKIYTNNKPRPLFYGYELTPRERENFDYYDQDEIESISFFRYKGEVYDLGEFMRLDKNSPFLGWHGYLSDSFFSGILVKFCDDDIEMIVVGWYCS